MSFAGVTYSKDDIPEENNRTIAFVYRTNAGLVDKMLDLERNGKAYNITRSVESLFRIHRAIIFCKPGGSIYDPDLQFIQHDCDEWDSNPEHKRRFTTFIGYLRHKNENNLQVRTAIQTILKYTGRVIIEIYKQAKAHEDSSGEHQITLTTAHASKGCEYDIVHIGDDLNDITSDVISKYEKQFALGNLHPSEFLLNQELEEFRLYYVAATRAKLKLYNAKLLSKDYIIQDRNLKGELNGIRSMVK
jgi:superfamily I DNA/RNA helicase